MATNRRRLTILIAAFFLAASPLWAQVSGYYMELRFIQRLSWIGDEYAMRYEVIIEREEEGRYKTILREFTEASLIEVSLHPGKYRYQVIPRDFFDQPIPVTEWVEFEVRPGDDQLTMGEHELVIVNPGDEKSRKEIILAVPGAAAAGDEDSETAAGAEKSAEYKKRVDVYLGASWTPFFPVYGKNEFSGENLSFIGASLRFAAVSAKQNILNPGIELSASWRAGEDGEKQAAAFDLNILAQSRFPGGRTALNLRLGAGLSLLSDIQPASAAGRYSIHLNSGVSFLLLFTENFYMEGGAEFSQFFTEDHFGFFRPWIGLGCRF